MRTLTKHGGERDVLRLVGASQGQHIDVAHNALAQRRPKAEVEHRAALRPVRRLRRLVYLLDHILVVSW